MNTHNPLTYQVPDAHNQECDLCGNWIDTEDEAGWWREERPVHISCLP